VSAYSNKTLISLPVKETDNTALDKLILDDALESLMDITQELELRTISILRSDRIDSVTWAYIRGRLAIFFDQAECELMISLNVIQTPPPNRRNDLIEESHTSAFDGHKEVTKTYNRLRQKYHWTHMKVDVQAFIQNYLGYQRKKLVNQRQLMLFTDIQWIII